MTSNASTLAAGRPCAAPSVTPTRGRRARLAAAWVMGLLSSLEAGAAVGLAELPRQASSGPVTVFYPTAAAPSALQRGAFTLSVAPDAPPTPGRHRLVVISHGSGASPWVHADLARALVEAGFIVALPEHFGDNHQDGTEPGPPSWKRRPQEVTRAIDRLQADARFGPVLAPDRIGMFGMSAGGHTALTLAGGRWSPGRLLQHCNQHLEQDFHTCAGPTTALDGGLFDGLKVSVVDDGQRKDLSPEARSILYRATRELLINAAKHAQAESAEVEIERVGGSIVVRVRDCGVGFDPQVLAAAKGQGLGLLSVRERLAFIGGSAELASLPGDGTLATLTAPLADAASEA